jgi:dipeptide transport system permease protein
VNLADYQEEVKMKKTVIYGALTVAGLAAGAAGAGGQIAGSVVLPVLAQSERPLFEWGWVLDNREAIVDATVEHLFLTASSVAAGLALSLVYLPHYVRLTRASVLTEINKDYVISSRVAGAGALRLMFIVILPNCLAPLIVQATLGFSNAILDMAALGFLGLGAQAPLPEWGNMLATAREFIQSAWWVVTFPGLTILVTVLAFNLMGDGLRDALDPKLKQ